ncbi:MAG: hypothetical protein ACYDAQ_11740, partial [Mycobacteriales bacterium]
MILAVLRRVPARFWRAAGVGVGLAAVALLLLAARHTLAQLGGQLHRLSPGAVGGALGLTLLGTGATVLPWRAVLADLGSPLSVRPAVRVYFLGQLGKYLPGSLWPVA